jgi:hypothetical protein
MMAEQETGAWDDAFPLEIKAVLDGRADGRVVGVSIANVPVGASLSAGIDDGGGRWSLVEGDLEGLSISPPHSGAGKTTLMVSLLLGREAAAHAPETVAFGMTLPPTPGYRTSTPEPEPEPELLPEPAPDPEPEPEPEAAFDEGRAIALDIDTGYSVADPPPDMAVVISGVPRQAALSAGRNNGDGNWFLNGADMKDLRISPAAGADGDFILGMAVAVGDGPAASGGLLVEVGQDSAPEPESEPTPTPIVHSGSVDPVPTAGPRPIAYWKLDESAGSTAADEMGAHPGHVIGNSGDADGAFLPVAEFDGIDDYIQISAGPDLMVRGGTLTVWFSAFAAGSGTIAAKGAPENAGHFALSIRNARLQVLMHGPDGDHVMDAGVFGANEWNQATVTWGAGGMKAYLNGAPTGSGEYTGGLEANDGPWTFGATDAGDGYFHGELDDIALYAEQLSDAEVRDLCQVGVEGVMTGESPAEVDSSLDFSTIPAAGVGPESLDTLDAPPLGDTQGIDDMLAGLAGDAPESLPEPVPELAPEPESAPLPPVDAAPQNSAISIGEGGDLIVEGGEKLQW